jgi:hypothetical protein
LVYKWDLKKRALLCKYAHPDDGGYIYGLLSFDNKKLMLSAWGPNVYVIETEKDET